MNLGARIAASVVSGGVVAVLVAANGCGSEPGIDRQTITDATVRVRADGCGPRTELGTGTLIADGLVVTAAHVVAGAERVEIIDDLGEPTTAAVVAFDPGLDVAALRPVRAFESPAPLRAEPGRAGERGVIGLVTPDGSVELIPVDVMQRVTIRTTDISRDDPVRRSGLRVAVTVDPGDSGAMVHLPRGGVGIVWSRSTETGDQAWTVDLPEELLDPTARRSLLTPVDTGPCL